MVAAVCALVIVSSTQKMNAHVHLPFLPFQLVSVHAEADAFGLSYIQRLEIGSACGVSFVR